MRALRDIIAVAVVLVTLTCVLNLRRCSQEAPLPDREIRRDTIVVRDTIYPLIPEPATKTVVRRDTVRLHLEAVDEETPAPAIVALGDTIEAVSLPISRRTYAGEDYKAVVEGYDPRLVEIEIYRDTRTVLKTVYPRWVLSVGVGAGIGRGGAEPYIGVTLGYVLWGK